MKEYTCIRCKTTKPQENKKSHWQKYCPSCRPAAKKEQSIQYQIRHGRDVTIDGRKKRKSVTMETCKKIAEACS